MRRSAKCDQGDEQPCGKQHNIDECGSCNSDHDAAHCYSANLLVENHYHSDGMEHNDNRESLFKQFELVTDELHQKYAAGYQWFCKRCGKPCLSQEIWFPCKGRFMTVKVFCHIGCNSLWKLKIDAGATTERITLH